MTADSPGEARRPHPVVSVVPALGVTVVDAALLAWAMGSVQALLAHHRALALLALWAAGGVALALLRPMRGHDAASVELYLQETFTFLVYTSEAAVALATAP